jgi:hypothetical protein
LELDGAPAFGVENLPGKRKELLGVRGDKMHRSAKAIATAQPLEAREIKNCVEILIDAALYFLIR